MVCALLQAKDVRHAELAARIRSDAQTQSTVRRIERFFDQHPLDQLDTARVVLKLLTDSKKRRFILDRTNWVLGTRNINVLMLAVVWRSVAIPLLYELLPHGGSSNQHTRAELLRDALTLLKAQDIECLLGDREFIGEDWFDELHRQGVPYGCRVRDDTPIDDIPARQWFPDLLPGQRGVIAHEALVYGVPLNVAIVVAADGDRVMIAGNAPATKLLELYQVRWKIECLFRHLKSKGFKLENTHMTLHDHLERLLCLLTIAFVCSVLVGLEEPSVVKRHGRRAWSVFTLGLRRLVQAFTQAASGHTGMMLGLIERIFPALGAP